ncbi:hypothetical protein E2R51_16885 [Jeotgalibacillus sp. S-D1]|uniref:hypothetical protein n=1 Tax=Jeotgalibacillus sp. S-D1 TaxID=2552189 RepID=UPI00105AA98F|nr:hypothetical protein [Jeotgalibacillus sp. S-D1]TDL30666.1 hypothetical protein E2R51_16885 [Jeotgalibacillus sp. S-D1]
MSENSFIAQPHRFIDHFCAFIAHLSQDIDHLWLFIGPGGVWQAFYRSSFLLYRSSSTLYRTSNHFYRSSTCQITKNISGGISLAPLLIIPKTTYQ